MNDTMYNVEMFYLKKKKRKFLINAYSDDQEKELFEIEIVGNMKINYMLA
jgi:hypothetical protein